MKASKNIAFDEMRIEDHIHDLFSFIHQELELSGDDQFKRSIEQRLLKGSQNNFLVRVSVFHDQARILIKANSGCDLLWTE